MAKKKPAKSTRGYATTSIPKSKPKEEDVEDPAEEGVVAADAVGPAVLAQDTWESAAPDDAAAPTPSPAVEHAPVPLLAPPQARSAVPARVEADFRSSAARRAAIEADPTIPALRLDERSERMLFDLLSRLDSSKVADGVTRAAEMVVEGGMDGVSVAGKLLATWLGLEKCGVAEEWVMKAMEGSGGMALGDALDWLCFNMPMELLPAGFTDKITMVVEESMAPLTFTAAKGKPTDKNLGASELESVKAEEPASVPATVVRPAVIDSAIKKRILLYQEENDPADSLPDTMPAPADPPHVEHARLTLAAEDLKARASAAKRRGGAGDPEVQAALRGCMTRIRDIEGVRGWEKIKRKAEVEYTRLLMERAGRGAGEDEMKEKEEAVEGKREKTKEVVAKKSSTEDSGGAPTEEDDDDDVMGAMFDSEAATGTPAPTTTEAAVVRSMPIPPSWTGATPKNMLRDHVTKLGKGIKVKFSRAAATGRGVRCQVRIEGGNVPGVARTVVMGEADRCETLKEAEEFVSTLAMFEMSGNLPLYRSLPPAYRDLWMELLEKKETEEGRAAREAEERRMAFLSSFQTRIEAVATTVKRVASKAKGSDFAEKLAKEIKKVEVDSAESGRLKADLERRMTTAAWQELLVVRKGLPVMAMRDDIVNIIDSNQVVIISGETGSGKSTQIPQFILEHYILTSRGSLAQVLCTQPRRLSALSLASRVSEEIGDGSNRVGDPNSLVGSVVRLDVRTSRSTRLTFLTTGVLLRRLESDPDLAGVSHVVVDECHERGMETDFLLVLLRRALRRRLAAGNESSLKVILMSATADADRFRRYFEQVGIDCPVVTVPGRTFPVEALYVEDAVERCGYVLEPGSEYEIRAGVERRDVGSVVVTGKGGKGSRMKIELEEKKAAKGFRVVDDEEDEEEDGEVGIRAEGRAGGYSAATLATLGRMDPRRINLELIEALVRWLVAEGADDDDGSILVFLPGLAEIRRVYDRLSGGADQAKVFKPPPRGVRKVVLATNIAETGITIPDVVYVIDACKAREVSYDERRHITRLSEVLVSQANCRQRRGRAGRVRPGICYHLVPPEILRMPLEELVLQAVAMLTVRRQHSETVDIEGLLAEALDPPPVKHVERAITVLKQIQALTSSGLLTPLGSRLAGLPVDARLGKMLLHAAALRCLDPILTVAASLSLGKDPFQRRFEDSDGAKPGKKFKTVDSDLLTISNVYTAWRSSLLKGGAAGREFVQKNGLSFFNLTQIEEARSQLLRVLVSSGAVALAQRGPGGGAGAGKEKAERLPYPLLTSIPDMYNGNARSNPILLTTIASGLYPSFLIMDGPVPASRNSRQVFLHSPGSADPVRVHGKSVVGGGTATTLPPGWYAAHLITRTEGFGGKKGTVVAWDVNRVGDLGAAFSAGSGIVEHRLRAFVFDGGKLVIKCPPRSAVLLAKFFELVRTGMDRRMALEDRGVGGSQVKSEDGEEALGVLIKLLELEGKTENGRLE
ncbi:hypothetical protein HK101_008478 [Irineochytrium annulatum]|nr:hypothetical protein HK101_008478 [Irineochytrium annulatum]